MMELARQKTLRKPGALQKASFNIANFSGIATDAEGSSRFLIWGSGECWVMLRWT